MYIHTYVCCIYIRMCACMPVCEYVCMYVNMHEYKYTPQRRSLRASCRPKWLYKSTLCRPFSTYRNTYIYINACVYVNSHTHTHNMYTHTDRQTHTYTRTHTLTHTLMYIHIVCMYTFATLSTNSAVYRDGQRVHYVYSRAGKDGVPRDFAGAHARTHTHTHTLWKRGRHGQHTLIYVKMREHTSIYIHVKKRHYTSLYVNIHTCQYISIYVNMHICRNTSIYVNIRQYTYMSICI